MQYIPNTLQKNVKYSVLMEVTEGDAVDLIVLDEVKFAKYDSAFTGDGTVTFQYDSAYSALSSKEKSYNIQLSSNTKFYFVIKNTLFIEGGAPVGGFGDIHLEVTYETSSPPPDGGNDSTDTDDPPDFTLVALLTLSS
jgi:hypothetical protein